MNHVVENYADHAFNFASAANIKPDEMTEGPEGAKTARVSASSLREGMILFPRAGKETDSKGNEKKVPSKTEVSDDVLKAMKASKVCRAWFGDGMLHVAENAESKREANRRELEGQKIVRT
jgi:hypothetical protein